MTRKLPLLHIPQYGVFLFYKNPDFYYKEDSHTQFHIIRSKSHIVIKVHHKNPPPPNLKIPIPKKCLTSAHKIPLHFLLPPPLLNKKTK